VNAEIINIELKPIHLNIVSVAYFDDYQLSNAIRRIVKIEIDGCFIISANERNTA